MLRKAASEKIKIFISNSVDKKKNPLTASERYGFLVSMFPSNIGHFVVNPEIRNILQVAHAMWKDGFSKLVVYTGEDRKEEFQTLLDKYSNSGPHEAKGYYFFADGIEVNSAGLRDPDSDDDTASISASKMRAAALDNDYKFFASGLPQDFSRSRDLFDALRKGMSIV